MGSGLQDSQLRDVSPRISDIRESFVCAFLPTLNLEGQVRSPQLLRKRNAEVSVAYIAKWSCEFFGFTDCMVPQLQLETAKPDGSGVFTIEIPDFSADPIAVSGIYGGELELILRDAKTWNHIAILAPESETLRTSGLALKIESSYPRNLALVEPKPN